MPSVIASISMSLDGYVAGPDPTDDAPLGRGGERLHEWVTRLEEWRASHGLEGGGRTRSSDVLREQLEASGAFVMGRRMFSGGEGPWADDARASGWWGDEPPFGAPVFVLTHHPREPLTLGRTTFTFVTAGVEAAVAAAREAAPAGKAVHVSGGAEAIQQTIAAGLLDQLDVHLVPVLLGGGRRLFERLGPVTAFEPGRVLPSEGVTHLRYVPARA